MPQRSRPRFPTSRRAPFIAAVAAALIASSSALRAQDAPDDPDGTRMNGMMGAGVQRDAAYFRDQVQPQLLLHCTGCHADDDLANETRYRLQRVPKGETLTDDQVQQNYATVVALLDAGRPERSRLLQKVTPLPWGGIDHDGGKADGEAFPLALIDARGPLITWVFGGNERTHPPVAVSAPVARTVDVGAGVHLDASLSFDPDGEPVRITWDLVEAPLGSKAKIAEPGATATDFVPDRPGPYVLALRVTDGKLDAWPRLLRFAAVRPAGKAPATGEGGAADVRRISTRERRLTRALYLDVLGRTPIDEELALACAVPYEERVDQLLGDVDAWKQWLEEENFYFLLIDGFRPVSDRVVALPAQILNREIDYRDAHTALALSAEFNARNPGNDTYVTVVLEQFLGIEVQSNARLLEDAKKMYDGKLSRIFGTRGQNQSDVVQICLAQPGYTDLFVRRMEERLFGERLPDEEHAAAVTFLSEHPKDLRGLVRGWLLSPRYTSEKRVARTKSDHQFIRSLFVDLLGRPPAREEFRNMRNALQALADPAPLRGVLAKVILDSGAVIAPAALAAGPDSAGAGGATDDGSRVTRSVVIELFQRLLGRDPGDEELEVFTKVLREDGATWRTAALALLTSAHYQYY